MTSAERCEHLRARGGWAEDRLLGRCTFPIALRNTWSSLAYVAAGSGLYGILGTPEAGVMAMALTILGLGSFVYHGAKTVEANWVDLLGMHATFGSLAAYAVSHDWLWMLAAAALACGLLLKRARTVPGAGNQHMAWFLAFALGWAMFRGSFWLAGAGMICFGVSYVAWKLDRREWDRRRPVPITGRWGHAAWHIGTAAALTLMFLAQGGAP